jgi:hypothetical protein
VGGGRKVMSKKIWKFEASIADYLTITTPKGAEIIDLRIQRGMPCLWAIVDPDAIRVDRFFRWVGTGHEITFDGSYVGTVQSSSEALVFHLFEVPA